MTNRTLLPVATFVGGLLLGVSATAGAGPTPVQEPAALVVGIGGVFMKADDPAALRDWYRRHLGVEAGPQGHSFLWREHDDPDREGRTVWSVFPGDTDYFGPGGQAYMVNYIVRDLDAVLARLAEAGIEPVKAPESYPYGRFAWVLDGGGNRIELWQPPPEE